MDKSQLTHTSPMEWPVPGIGLTSPIPRLSQESLLLLPGNTVLPTLVMTLSCNDDICLAHAHRGFLHLGCRRETPSRYLSLPRALLLCGWHCFLAQLGHRIH